MKTLKKEKEFTTKVQLTIPDFIFVVYSVYNIIHSTTLTQTQTIAATKLYHSLKNKLHESMWEEVGRK